MKTSSEIRKTFLAYFADRGHKRVRSGSVNTGKRLDAAFHQRWDESIQGRFSGIGEASLYTGNEQPEVHARQRQTQ